ncbi:diguanylate cyclase [Conexibacter woesei]|uniref:sensor domain-containing diguanylate cyclase n=1 Tax=Conexibacter woesei TaxID=191495 RepID=UPI0003F73785|nr:diguanylate cyclase [Conexibacter woesei]
MTRPAKKVAVLFTACLAVILALLPIADGARWGEVVLAVLLLTGSATTLISVSSKAPWTAGRRWLGAAGLAVCLVGIALMRDSVGPSAGYGPLIFLPVLWSALERRRRDLAFVLVGVALVYFTPLLLGLDRYPTTQWRGAILMVVVSGGIGYAVIELVEHVRNEAGRSAAILGAMGEGFALTRDGVIVQVNPALTAITGFPESELLGMGAPFAFWPPESAEVNAGLLRRVVAEGGGSFAIELVRRDGTRFPAEISALPTDVGDGTRCFLNTVRDVTALRAHEDAQRRHAEQLASIADVLREIGHCDPLEVRPTICRTALALCDGAHAVSLWELGSDGALTTTATLPETTAPYRVAGSESEHGAHYVMRTGTPLFVAEAAASPHCDRRIIRLLGAESVLFIPIGLSDASSGARGALAISWPARRASATDNDMLLVGVLAGEAAIAMQRADLLGRLDELTRTDELTGLPNRRAWDELLVQELAVAERHGDALSVAMLDLDFFKRYNDEHGHLAGDRLLRAAAAAWQSTLRSSDVLARWGGEEFALMLPGCDGAGAARLIERLRGTLPDNVTFSAGVATSDGRTAPRALIDAADQALYSAKAGGRDRVVVG